MRRFPVDATPRETYDAQAGRAGGRTTPSNAEPFYAEHLNVRADRYEAYATLLQPGRRRISCIALATTPGEFTAPSPRAEEMYAPETFGRGVAERVSIEVRQPGG